MTGVKLSDILASVEQGLLREGAKYFVGSASADGIDVQRPRDGIASAEADPTGRNALGGSGVRSCAFTLIEVLIALTLIAIVAATLASTLRIAYHATRTAEAAIEPSRTVSVAMEMLSNDIQNALPGGGQYAQSFEGTQAQDDRGHEADDLVFYSTAESPQHSSGNGEIKKVELTVEKLQDGSDYVLVRRVLRNLGSQLTPAPDEEILCRGVSSFALQYFDGSSWNTAWDSTAEDNTVPASVQVTVELNRPVTPGGAPRILRYTRVISISSSNAPFDPAVNSGVSNL